MTAAEAVEEGGGAAARGGSNGGEEVRGAPAIDGRGPGRFPSTADPTTGLAPLGIFFSRVGTSEPAGCSDFLGAAGIVAGTDLQMQKHRR